MQLNEFKLNMFSERLKDLRKERNLSSNDVGNAIGVSHSIIHRWEKAKKTPGIDKLFMLAQYFGVSAGYLIGLED